MDRERLALGPGGWVRYAATDLDEHVHLRLAEAADGRLVIDDLFVGFDTPPGARLLRRVAERAARAERLANSRRYGEAIRRRLSTAGPDLRADIGSIRWVGIPTHDQIEDVGIKVVDLALELERPEERPYPDAFYAAVADAYSKAVAHGRRAPAAAIATASDVPVKTVHGWVAEARRRGHLAAGRRGRAG